MENSQNTKQVTKHLNAKVTQVTDHEQRASHDESDDLTEVDQGDFVYDQDYRYILTMMDDNSRFLRAVAISDHRKETIEERFLNHWIAVFGIPKETIADIAKELIGDSMQQILKEGGGVIVPTAPYSPEQNAVERVHRKLMQRIRALSKTYRESWYRVLP